MARRRRVALIIETSTTYGRRILRGVRRYVDSHDSWSMFLEQRSLTTRLPQWLEGWDGDGMMSRSTTRPLAEAAARGGISVVDLTDRHGHVGLPQVWSDDAAIGRMAADHLVERGFRQFAFCGFSRESWSARRRDAYASVAARLGQPCPSFESPWYGRDAPPWEVEQARIADWLRSLPRPVGVMACNDVRGQHVLDACKRADLSVPEDVAVVGVDDDEEVCELADPALTSVIPNADLIGYRAAEVLDRMMAGARDQPDCQIIPPLGMATRQSTDSLAIDDPDVAAAVRYIREHACRGAIVDDVLEHVPVSRSILERRFRKSLDCSPQALIRRTQLKRVKQLLVDTELPLARISELAGFKHHEHMCTVFKREVGDSPGVFRRKSQK